MKSATIFLLALFFLSFETQVFSDDPVDAIKEYMDATVEVDQFNGAVLVAGDDRVLFSQGFGMANFEHDVPNAPNTKFRIGSITKQFTAMAIMVLQEHEKLDVNDLISKHLADTPDAWSDVTIHHLLTHTSGVPSFTSMVTYRFNMHAPQTIKQMIDRFRDKPLDFEPGEKFRYSNSGYFLLGAIVEEASGKSYEEFLRTEVFDPLELNDTGYDRFRSVLPHRATGYERQKEELVHAYYLDMSQPYAAGALYSTVEDLYRWDQALRRGELISKDAYIKMYAPEKEGYAYGWSVKTKNGRKSISHGGGINGFLTYILRVPDKKLCVVVLCNVTPANSEKVAQDLAAIVLGEEYEVPMEAKSK